MTEYQQYGVREDAFLREQAPKEWLKVLIVGLVAGAITAGGFWLLRGVALSTEQVFNICLLTASLVSLIAYARLRTYSGMLVFVANLLAFWSFFVVDEPQLLSLAVFVPVFAVVSLLFDQIFRIRKVWLAILLCLPLVVLPHLT